MFRIAAAIYVFVENKNLKPETLDTFVACEFILEMEGIETNWLETSWGEIARLTTVISGQA